MKKTISTIRSILAALLLAVVMFGSYGSALAASDAGVIDVEDKMQTYDGWGTALAWWANTYGGHTNIVDGQEQRKNITDMLFTDKGLNLNIARYNLGTCETPDNPRWDPVLNMPPYVTGPDEDYKWDNDPRQKWVLEEFLRVQENAITEMWVNTAPYWMCVSGSATGPVVKTDDNLKPECVDDFAAYLVDILEHFDSEGIRFDYIEPMNEPNSGYTEYMGPNSGCRINFGESQSDVLTELYEEQKRRGIEGKYPIAGTDELSTTQAAYAWSMLSHKAQNAVAKINTHTYMSDKKSMELLKKAAYGSQPDYDNPKKKLWMSERTLHMGPEPTPFYYGIALAQEIIDNIKIMGVNAWCHWQAADELGVNEFNTDWRYDMQFFTLGNFSRYITPGSRILNAGDERTVAALTPENKLVVVTTTGLAEQNPGRELYDKTREVSFRVKNAKLGSVQKVVTTPESTAWTVEKVESSGQTVSVTLPQTSVVTLIIELKTAFPVWGIVLIVIGGVLVLGGAALGAILLVKKNKSKEQKDDQVA